MESKINSNNILALLGPTNTGKTYRAFERLIAYKSGIFGFPLRLLARENYDRALSKLGRENVALITGEEKILPKNPKYFFCTVESMPLNIEVECIAIDEVQLAADYERGHVFTDRIINLRGTLETIFLGSLTIKNILKKMFPKIKIEERDRFSKLTCVGTQTFKKLKPRSAIIAFNINQVYEIAEIIRSYKGGAAVVLGSLSPKTRNAQVEIYENKNVDYLIATDAIGMGLNLNIDNILFSSFQKFDGRYQRNLTPAEIGQIAGRAGRFQNNGTFGYTKNAGFVDEKIIKNIEDHNFDEIKKIYWRNSKINFSSVISLITSLKEYPINNYFIHKKNAEDEVSFKFLSSDQSINKYLIDEVHVRLLWDVCRIPDFQKILNDNYLELLKNIFLNIVKNKFLLSEDWINQKVSKLEDYSGGIDELSRKISKIRTLTYISNQANWLKNNEFWQNKTRKIEDNLSDKLHESLKNRFVDVSASYFSVNKNKEISPTIEVESDNSINLEGQKYGYNLGFNLILSDKLKSISIFSHNHVKKRVRIMIEDKLNNFLKAPDDSINLGNIKECKLNDQPKIFWGEEVVGTIKKGKNIFSPIIEVTNSEFIDSEKKVQINKKLQNWIDTNIKNILKPIKEDIDKVVISSSVRSIVFNLFNSLGAMSIADYQNELKNLSENDKSTISKLGIRMGAKYFFIPIFMKKQAMELNAILWRVFNESNLNENYPLPKDGRVSFISEVKLPESYWLSIGYLILNKFAVRIDVFERIFFLARKRIKQGPFLETSELMNPIGCNSEELSKILDFCGFDYVVLSNEKKLFSFKQKQQLKTKAKSIKIKKKKAKNKTILKPQNKKIKPDPNSPFAVLQKLL